MCPIRNTDGNNVLMTAMLTLRLRRGSLRPIRFHSFKLSKREYKTWIIYLVIEPSIWFPVQKGMECAYNKLSTMFGKWAMWHSKTIIITIVFETSK